MIEVKHLTKRYGKHTAVDDISFTVQDGCIYGLLGPNGAGKSTTMNMITGYLAPTGGTVAIDGHDIQEEPKEAKACIGYLPEIPPLYTDMTVQEYLLFVSELKGKKKKADRVQDVEQAVQRAGLQEMEKRLIRNLSKGYRQRVGIAQALLGNPGVLILDEPTVGLDPNQIIEIRNLIRQLGKHHTVILSSHILPEVQAVCERVIIIDRGQIIADGTPDQLSHDLSSDHRLLARIAGPQAEVEKLLRRLPNVVSIVPLGEREPGVTEYSIETETGTDPRRALFERLAERGWPLMALRSTELTLEEVFINLTNGSYSGMKLTQKKGDAV